MTGSVTVRPARTPQDMNDARQLCWEYRDYLLAFDQSMQEIVDVFYPQAAYAALMQDLPVKHARPDGEILIAAQNGQAIGCAMMHALNDHDVEIKRVFVRAEARGTGAGEKLSQALVDQARADGRRRVLLDTNMQFAGARRLYERLGFQLRGPYSDIPAKVLPMLVFYELTL